ncbi:MAG: hypothetical protein KIT83_22270 [Bryobacterales bacterium]|nr:hypothetical protein [Bryobacterales bacterium]
MYLPTLAIPSQRDRRARPPRLRHYELGGVAPSCTDDDSVADDSDMSDGDGDSGDYGDYSADGDE